MFKCFAVPKEVKDTCKAIENGILDNIASPIIRAEAIKRAKDKKITVDAINVKGYTPSGLAHVLITNVIQTMLGSGNYHIYRGTLSMIGNAMLESWDYSIDQIYKYGEYTLEEASEDKKWLRAEIKKIG